MADIFDRFKYGNIKVVDLHGLTREEAHAEIIYHLNSIDTNYDGIEFIHGYHGGNTLKNLVRNDINHPIIAKKVNISASSTIILTKK